MCVATPSRAHGTSVTVAPARLVKARSSSSPAEQDIVSYSRGLQVSGGQVDAVLAKRRRRPDQRVGALDFQFRREPRPPQDSRVGPLRRGEVVLGGKVLGQCREKRVPSLVPDGRWFISQQRGLIVVRLPPDIPPGTPTRVSTGSCRQPSVPGGRRGQPESWGGSRSRRILR